MTSLLTRPDRHAGRRPTDPARHRPLVLVATVGGAAAALAPLLVLLAVGVIGWFVSDAGAHGAPRDGMQVGALAWLAAHGSGLTVQGSRVEIVPLGLTALCAWSTWRVGHRVGEAVSGHGPDADRISDGERDLTVPTAVAVFLAAYAVVAAVVATLAAGATAAPSLPRVLVWSIVLTAAVAGPAIAIGSGRAAIWATLLPATVRAGAAVARACLLAVLGVSVLTFTAAFAVAFGDAATMASRLHLSAGEATLYAAVNVAYLPNAAVFTGSWLLGPGFSVGVGTLVSPAAVVLGPLPLLPLLAALPAPGTPAGWTAALTGLPALAAALAAPRPLRRRLLPWDQLVLAGCGGGIAAGVLLALLASVAGGAAGPGRMRQVGPSGGDVLVHAVTALGLGALVGSLVLLGWRWVADRRRR